MNARRVLRVLLPVVVLLVAGVGFAYLVGTRPEAVPRAAEERVWPVAAVPAERRTIAPESRAFGQVFAGRRVDLRPLVDGRINETGPDFDEGGIVAEGGLLVAIDPFDYRLRLDEARAQLAEAKGRRAEIAAELEGTRQLIDSDREQVRLRQRDVQRRESLAGKGVSSEKALDDAKLALAEARQQLIQREREARRLDTQATQQDAVIDRIEASVRQAERDLENTRLVAPFTGFLADVDADVGKRVSQGDRIARLIDPGRLEARFQLSDDQFGRLLESGEWRGRPVRVVWHAGGKRFTFDASLDRIEGEIEAARGGVEVFARIEGLGPETPLRPGAFVEVFLTSGSFEDVVRIPDIALHDGERIFMVEDGRLKAVAVEVVAEAGNDVLLRSPSSELPDGASIVTTRFPEMATGVRVEVR